MPSIILHGSRLSRQAIICYLALSTVVLVTILRFAPHFSYSLDDPYIHLALAQNILHGHYGINPKEVVSPSSSVVWPFLLAPFSQTPMREWVPLGWNVLFSLATCFVMGRLLAPRLQKLAMGQIESLLFALVIVIAADLVGLTFIGMEHCLQILLVSLCADAVITAYDGKAIPGYCLAAAALAPAIRYEDLAFTAAVCAIIWLQKRRTAAVVIFALSLLPIVALGIFLRAHGLSFFPNSVLAKSNLTGLDSGGLHSTFGHLFGTLETRASFYFRPGATGIRDLLYFMIGRVALAMLFLGVAFLGWKNRAVRPLILLSPALAASLAMMLLGPDGSDRYEVCVRLFLFLIVLCLALELHPGSHWLIWVCGILAAVGYVPALVGTAASSIRLARQQYQMHRFTSDFANENVAVNDLGWVSFDVRGRFYVLDLVGLGSNETLRVADKTPKWLDSVTREHNVGLVMIYPGWFGPVPSDWQLLGVLKQKPLIFKGHMGGSAVNFYATSPQSAERIAPELRRFSASLPPDVWFEFLLIH